MWRRLQVKRLLYQNFHFLRTIAQHLEVRQVRVKVESADAPQEIKSIRLGIDLDRGR
jgi:hypothetical protein